MKIQIVVATQNGFARFNFDSVQFVDEARDASLFNDHRSANNAALQHGMKDGFILVDVSQTVTRLAA